MPRILVCVKCAADGRQCSVAGTGFVACSRPAMGSCAIGTVLQTISREIVTRGSDSREF